MGLEEIAFEQGLTAKSAGTAETTASALAVEVAWLVPTTCLPAAHKAKIPGPKAPQAARGRGLKLPEEGVAGRTPVARGETKDDLKDRSRRSSLLNIGQLGLLLGTWIAPSSTSEYEHTTRKCHAKYQYVLRLYCCRYGGADRGATAGSRLYVRCTVIIPLRRTDISQKNNRAVSDLADNSYSTYWCDISRRLLLIWYQYAVSLVRTSPHTSILVCYLHSQILTTACCVMHRAEL